MGLIHLFVTTTGVCVVCLHVCGYSVGNVLQSMCGSLHGSAESAYELPVKCVGVCGFEEVWFLMTVCMWTDETLSSNVLFLLLEHHVNVVHPLCPFRKPDIVK